MSVHERMAYDALECVTSGEKVRRIRTRWHTISFDPGVRCEAAYRVAMMLAQQDTGAGGDLPDGAVVVVERDGDSCGE